ncbi:MAG: Hsp20/alpha crystallin family protein [Geobacter sp.]|nr:MAG: Hsp20/alpha crystallin family protein [Geobacter sp.]
MAETQKEKEVSKREQSGEMESQERRRLRSPLEEMERWFEESFSRPFFSPRLLGRFGLPELTSVFTPVSPQVDIYEDRNDVVVKAEIPGIKKEDIEINVKENMITISGEKKGEEKVERKDYYRLERSFGSFSRHLHLPTDIQADKAKATFRDGVLEVRIPKSEAAKQQTKKIPIE